MKLTFPFALLGLFVSLTAFSQTTRPVPSPGAASSAGRTAPTFNPAPVRGFGAGPVTGYSSQPVTGFSPAPQGGPNAPFPPRITVGPGLPPLNQSPVTGYGTDPLGPMVVPQPPSVGQPNVVADPAPVPSLNPGAVTPAFTNTPGLSPSNLPPVVAPSPF